MVIKCPLCGHQGKIDPAKIPSQGANAKCPGCRGSFAVRRPASSQQSNAGQIGAQSAHSISPAGPPAQQLPEVQAAPGQPSQPAAPEAPGTGPTGPSSTSEGALGFKDRPAPASSQISVPPGGEGLSFKDPPPERTELKTAACTGCLKLFNENELTEVDDRNLCQSCQDAFRGKGQTPVEGRATQGVSRAAAAKKSRFQYGGFWIRVGAYLVDAFLLFLVWQFVLSPIFMKAAMNMFAETALPAAMSFPQDSSTMSPAEMETAMAQMQNTMNTVAGKMIFMVWIVNLIGILIMGGYFIILEGGPGYTLGKKALGLRVVTPEGDSIGYLRAFARYVGKIISGVILCIGFIMAAFDDEKRTLHDRMVNSRVVKV